MNPPPPLLLHHDRGRNLWAAAFCAAFTVYVVIRWWQGLPGVEMFLPFVLMLFGGYGLWFLLRALDRKPVAVIGQDGILVTATMRAVLPWSQLVEVKERRHGTSYLILYVEATGPYLRNDAPPTWNVKALVGKMIPGFERPQIELPTTWLDHSHATIREAVSRFWGSAR